MIELTQFGAKPVVAPISLGLAMGRWARNSDNFQGLWEGLALPHPGTRGLRQSRPGLALL